MPARKRTPTKPKSATPQTPEKQDEFATVDWAVAQAEGFLTSKIIRRLQDIGTAARRDDVDADSAVIAAGVRLSEDLRIADPEEWQRTTGRELPRNVEEIRALMADCGFSPDFIAAGEWTPCEVGPVLMKKLPPVAGPASYSPAKLRAALRELEPGSRLSSRSLAIYAAQADVPPRTAKGQPYTTKETVRILNLLVEKFPDRKTVAAAKRLLTAIEKPAR